MANNPHQRGLELLIRTRGPDGQDSIEIKVYRPDRAFLRMRPVRRADLRIDENVIDEEGGRVHVLHLVDSGRHLQLSESEYAVWRRMDGRHSIQDLAAALVIEYGRFDFDEIRRTLGRLRGAGLIDERPPGVIRHRDVDTGRPVRSLARRIMELDLRREGVDGLFSALHRPLRPLFGWPLGILGAVVTLGGSAVYLG
ncbi:MAG: PqqD family protein, partial [Deltaproteobacteria bacterium]